jgi:hypothetical protein
MAKEKVKLSLEQMPDDQISVFTPDEAKEVAAILKKAAQEADDLTDDKKEGRVEVQAEDGRITVSVTKVKIEKEEADEDES